MYKDIMKNLITANQTMCCVEGLTYTKALELITELGVRSVKSNIVVGGVQIQANAKDTTVIMVCNMFKTQPSPGVTMKCEDAILRKNNKPMVTIANAKDNAVSPNDAIKDISKG